MEPVKKDADDNSIYFVGGDSELFRGHILPYLESNDAMLFPGDTKLWHRLRAQAVFYGMDNLVESLDMNCPTSDGNNFVGYDDNENESNVSSRTSPAVVSTNDDNAGRPLSALTYKNKRDDIIGLKFTDGRIYYCHRSTLKNATGTYFCARFGELISPGAEVLDASGTCFYFIERSGELFAYILEYLLTNCPGRLPPFSQDPELWRALRKESLFYGLDGLSALLHVTHSCKPNKDNRGILYWKGTKKGESDEYKNPNEIGAVHIGGWVDLLAHERRELQDSNVKIPFLARSIESRNALVQYRPSVHGLSKNIPNGRNALCSTLQCHSLACGQSFHRFPTVLDLKTVFVRLTHYSLRYDRRGMTHWNLEGSENGEEWDVLHEARNDPHLRKPSAVTIYKKMRLVRRDIEKGHLEKQASEALLSYAENELRHTWAINPPPTEFYRYFRLIGVGEQHDGNRCMHAVGLELFGDVHER